MIIPMFAGAYISLESDSGELVRFWRCRVYFGKTGMAAQLAGQGANNVARAWVGGTSPLVTGKAQPSKLGKESSSEGHIAPKKME
jgi:hypothetical protein